MDQIGTKLQQIGLAVIVTLLAVVFALQFGGPQAQGCGSGGATHAAKVFGQTITSGEFESYYKLGQFHRYPREVAEQQNFREHVLNGLIERELLARAATEVGFTTEAEDSMRKLARDGTALISLGVNAPPNLPSGEVPMPVTDQDGNFDIEGAKRYIKFGLGRTLGEFADAQAREALAQRMREMVLSTVTVSPEEVWDTFRRERDTATLEYVRFTPSFFGESLEPTDDELDAWIGENAEEVDREYQANRHRYTGLEKQVRSRHILVQIDSAGTDEEKEAARAKATALLGRARGGEDFEDLARDNSDDTGSARRGGDLGYNPTGRMVAEFDEAQFAMEIDEISEIVETQFGFHIIKVVGIREGDVPEDEAKRELADRLYRDARSSDLAEAAATDALEALRGGSSIEQLDITLGGAPTASPEGLETDDGTEPTTTPDAGAESVAETPERDPRAPQALETRAFGRADSPITGISDNGPIVRAAFELTAEDRVAGEVIEAGGEYFVIRLLERSVVNREDVEPEVAERMRNGLIAAKRREVLRLYVQQLRDAAVAEGAILRNEDILAYDDPENT
ncbi:MAG: peptidylprolyl isomerase [Deltaproteobacteria bacterium]|nr:peptidylprolyl isomerase [Deltaproteobacteria bacterium]